MPPTDFVDVSIITVNFNRAAVTEDLLSSIFGARGKRTCEVIVVDNGSTENPIPDWKRRYTSSPIRFIRSERNLGFAGGNNLAIRQARGKYVFFVNNDTIFTKGLVETLMDTMEANEEIGMLSPQINYYEPSALVQYVGFTKMNYYTMRNSCMGYRVDDEGQYKNKVYPTSYIHGAAMMVRKSALKKAGLMPEIYFLYYEEMDWCERIKEAGYQCWVDTHALIYHRESLSVGRESVLKTYYMNRNRILFARRNANFLQFVCFFLYFCTIVCMRNTLVYMRKRQYSHIVALLKAVMWNVMHLFDPVRKQQ
ncbi:glycosyltransferase family 2 protein [Olivibacter sitiensis]|uniref:glycosyltransferase family 2 protein n=1 Tax=Olivibacter sitiensis TaxID=376470 RepID=UPI00041E9EF3|nr:glycosyltransferase family 2 protein [Olivibacter sitiensis]